MHACAPTSCAHSRSFAADQIAEALDKASNERKVRITIAVQNPTSVFTAVTFTRLLASRWVRAKRPTEITI